MSEASADMMQLIMVYVDMQARLNTLGVEWHDKQITDQRFACKVYEELCGLEKRVRALAESQK